VFSPVDHASADGQITLSPTGQPTYVLVPYRDRIFKIKELEGFRVEFERDETGVVGHDHLSSAERHVSGAAHLCLMAKTGAQAALRGEWPLQHEG
jgi:hypothetical protein